MNKSTSLYLDFLRIVSALAVVISHLRFSWCSNGLFFPLEWGHNFVIIFFVLSGYLIAYTVDHKNKGPEKYLVDRFTRLYSVVIPALLFTYLIDYVGRHFNPGLYAGLVSDHQFLRFLLNLTFLQQVWGLSTAPSTNGVFWSLSYEFWYYILFWVFCYFNGARKYIGIVLVCLIIGIKILLLLPVWAFGAWVYNLQKKLKVSSSLAFLVFVVTLCLIVLLDFFWNFAPFSDRFVFGQKPLFFSANFVFDWVVGFLVAINILFFNAIKFSFKLPQLIARGITYMSSITFSIYLFHLPMLVFAAAVIPYNKSSTWQILLIVVVIIFVISKLSLITEKQRGYLKQFLEKYFIPKNV